MLMAKQVLLACCTGQHCCPPPKNTFTRMYDASHASEVTKCQLGQRGIAMMGKLARQREIYHAPPDCVCRCQHSLAISQSSSVWMMSTRTADSGVAISWSTGEALFLFVSSVRLR